ncbi:MAG TPA: NAD(P)-dependent oxidoreductase [Afifellaceae bacterium]|nr:NAD(P)-dependent oxidoreductase [Afifellaceae bacterium]
MNGDPAGTDATPVTRVGFVGLGRMGRPMAAHAARGGFHVIGWDVSESAIAEAKAAGCRPAASLADCVRDCEAIFVIVPTDDDFTAACTQGGGIFANARPETVICACSSLLPETASAMAENAMELGLQFLDMPLTKGVRAAESGTMTVLAGGDAKVLARLRPVLETFSEAIHHVGGPGAGQVAKSVNNILLWSGLESAIEALTLGRAYGLDAEALRQALLDCSAESWVLRELQLIQPIWPAKDLENVAHMAEAKHIDMPLVDRLRDLAGNINKRQRITGLFRNQ